ncbi:uncharacterized protein LOC135400465 [Ornithodoros turicata]|uniref:uncharacterized protein LOC135400465 n=1 Tax=Ornithodoros turicata TaxID=34597 RepID=UPI00313892E4
MAAGDIVNETSSNTSGGDAGTETTTKGTPDRMDIYTRPITVMFLGDSDYGYTSRADFMIYGQSILNVVNAFFASLDIKIKMKAVQASTLTKSQLAYLQTGIPKTLSSIQSILNESAEAKAADLVFVLSGYVPITKSGTYAAGNPNSLCSESKVAVFADSRYSYFCLRALLQENLIFRILTNPRNCQSLRSQCAYNDMLDRYREALASGKCQNTNETFEPTTFSGVAYFAINRYCTIIGREGGSNQVSCLEFYYVTLPDNTHETTNL